MDLQRIAEQTDKYNFHSHTQYCDGRATMTEMAAAAAREGFRHWGFSPHSPVPIDSSCNMDRGRVDDYLAEVVCLKKQYDGVMDLYAGMEIDYLGAEWGPAIGYFKSLPLDYRIGSVHFLPSDSGFVDVDGRFESFKGKMERFFNDDIKHVVELFYRCSTDMVEAGGFDILGHFDKIGHNASLFSPGIEDTAWYRRLVDDMVDAIIASGVTVEINTKIWRDSHRIFPSERYLGRLIENGVPLLVNSDAHYPDKVNAGRDEICDMLRKMYKTNNRTLNLI